jgi:hypothetical protein
VTWFKVDDGLAFHPKAINAGLSALGLWVRAGAWCAANLTDGALPRHMIGTLGAQLRDAKRLVSAGLWCETEDGYQFHEWDRWQPTKAQVTAKREKDKKRQQEWREQHGHDVSHSVTDSVTNDVSHSAPTRPDPTNKEEVVEIVGTPVVDGVRGSRLPDDWMPSRNDVEWARERHPAVDSRSETDKFRDHWASQPGAKGRKIDWHATWRNWIRKAAEFQRPQLRAVAGGIRTHVDPSTGIMWEG